MSFLLQEDADRIDAIARATEKSLQQRADEINEVLRTRSFGGRSVSVHVVNNRLRFTTTKKRER